MGWRKGVEWSWHAGNGLADIVKIDPFDLMITIASLTVFTFVSLPMFQDLLSQTDDQVRDYIAHRKTEVIRMVKKILKP